MIIHVKRIGKQVLLPQNELEELVRLARRHGEVAVQLHDEDVPSFGFVRLAQQGGAFDFWLDEAEDVYSLQDGEPV